MKALPYLGALLGIAAYVVLGSAFDGYGERLGAGRVPDIGQFLGLFLSFQVPTMRRAAAMPGALWAFGAGIVLLAPPITAYGGWISHPQVPFSVHLRLASLDLAIGVLVFALLFPFGSALVARFAKDSTNGSKDLSALEPDGSLDPRS